MVRTSPGSDSSISMRLAKTGHRFVHGVVEDFRRQMMEGGAIGAADIHAGTAADGFQPFQNLDVLGGIAFGTSGARFLNRSGAVFFGHVCFDSGCRPT